MEAEVFDDRACSRTQWEFPLFRLRTLQDMLAEIGYTCFIPAQRHSSGVRPTGTTLGSDIDALVDADVERIIEDLPVVAREIGVEGLRTQLRQGLRRDNSALRKRRNALPSYPVMVSDEAVTQRIVDLDYAAYRKRRPAIRENNRISLFDRFRNCSRVPTGIPRYYG